MTNAPIGTTAEGLSDEQTATPEEAAVLNFEPWSKEDHSEDLFTPPTNQEWTNLGRRELPYVRLAFATMFKTKAELIEMFEANPDLMMRLTDDWKSSAETFENIGRIQGLLEGAHCRMLIAGAVVATRDPTS